MNLIFIDDNHNIKSVTNVMLETGLEAIKGLTNQPEITVGMPLEYVEAFQEEHIRAAAHGVGLVLLTCGDRDESYYYFTVGRGV